MSVSNVVAFRDETLQQAAAHRLWTSAGSTATML